MLISDWSSAVCSSDLRDAALVAAPIGCAQILLGHLARGNELKVLYKIDALRNLVARKKASSMRDKKGLIGWMALAHDDNRLHALAPSRVGHADHRDAGNGRMGRKHILDLGRIDILAARNDHVLGPIDDIIEAFLVAARDISRDRTSTRMNTRH